MPVANIFFSLQDLYYGALLDAMDTRCDVIVLLVAFFLHVRRTEVHKYVVANNHKMVVF